MPSDPEAHVPAAEAAYQSLDIDRMMALFDPRIVMKWNGITVAEGLDAVRQNHLDGIFGTLPDGRPKVRDYTIRKWLRAATGNVIGVEWEEDWIDVATGERYHGFGAEFWWLEADRLVEWHAYQAE